MFVSKIQFEQYKSINNPVEILFQEGKPTVLIGKNGSGKTNVLEALETISSDKYSYYNFREKRAFPFQATITLSAKEVERLLPNHKEPCEVIAFGDGEQMNVNSIRSDILVPLLKKEIEDLNPLADELKKAVADYEKQLGEIAHSEYSELPIHCFSIQNQNGSLTNYDILKRQVEYSVKNTKEIAAKLSEFYSQNKNEFLFLQNMDLRYLLDSGELSFRLQFVQPDLPPFERAFVSINEDAIKRAIERINKATKKDCETISRCMAVLKERDERLVQGLETSRFTYGSNSEQSFQFLREVECAVKKKCFYLRNETRDSLFRSEKREELYYPTDRTNKTIVETYLKAFYNGTDREELLSELNKNHGLVLSPEGIADFEEKLNESLPLFEQGMYDRIAVEQQENGQIEIFLYEQTGDKVALNETSSGRRWFFTYYFIKQTLEKGDLFIIDEPAGMLHPSAQKEILADLMALSKQGVQVVYSTHSPYLIPSDWQCVHFVSMGVDGTKVEAICSQKEMKETLHRIAGDDVFRLQEIAETFSKSDPQKVARLCYDALKNKFGTTEKAREELNGIVSEDAIKSWGKGKRSPKLENVILVAEKTDTPIMELL